MKKKILQEAAGVPKNILVTAQRLYSDIIKPLSKEINHKDKSYSFLITPNPQYIINDIEIPKCEITIEFHVDSDYDEIQVIRYGFLDTSLVVANKKDIWNRSRIQNRSPFSLIIEVVVPNNMDIPKFIGYLETNKIKTISILSHELKHYYDRVKRPNMNLINFTKYMSTNEMLSTGVKTLDKFMFYLYYMSSMETLVYSTEVYSELKQLNTTKEEFLSNLQQTRAYSKLKKIREYTMEVFLTELESESETIKMFYSDGTLADINFSSNREMVIDFLERIFDVVFKTYMSNLNNYLVTNPLEHLFGTFIDDVSVKNNKIVQLVNNANSFKGNPLRWYEKSLKTCSVEANKAIRKLSKIYSLLGNEEMNESILNPTKYSEIFGYDDKIRKLIKDAINNRAIKDN